ncbi:MAG: tetratricopeptide repeat protein [Bacteroidota bacterium]
MPKKQLISSIREQISVNQTEDALKALIDFFDKRTEDFGKMAKAVRLISSDFYELRQRQLQDTIKPEDHQRELNKIQGRLLALMDDLEAGRVSPSEQPAASPWKKYTLYALLGAGLVTLGLWFGGVLNFQKGCPGFDDNAAFRLLLLPLKSLDGSEASFASSIKSGLDDITQGQNVSIKVHSNYDIEQEGLPGSSDAEVIGTECDAEMVIWGTYEKPKDNYLVNIKYFFLGDETKLQLHRLEVQNSSDIAIVDAVSSIQTNEFLTSNIQSIINLMAGVMAHKHNDPKAAAKQFDKAIAEGSLSKEAEETAELLLADNLMMDSSNRQRAVEVYSEILERDPDNNWAINNRGLLYIKLEQYPEAIQYLDKAIESPKTSDNQRVLYNILKVNAHLNLDEVNEAEKDFIEAERISRSMPDSSKYQKTIKTHRAAIKTAKRKAQERLRGVDPLVPR